MNATTATSYTSAAFDPPDASALPATTAELLAVLLARDLADGEKAIIGTNSDIQVAACNLAKAMHAPRLWWVSGPGGMANPVLDHIIPTAGYANLEPAEAWLDLPDMIDFIDWQVHFFDFAILSVLQVDRHGNINTAVVGQQARPKLRGPGTVGISALCGLSKRFYVVAQRHDKHTFVPRVDFICGAGHLDGGDSRERASLPPGGPRLVVSPLGVFDFEPVTKAMRVRSLHPGVTLDQVRANTGFEVLCEGTPAVTELPTARELAVLRARVDRTGVLRQSR